MKKIAIAFFILIICSISTVYAVDDAIMNQQKESLNISSFIDEANKYTQKVLPEYDAGELLNSAIKGDLDNSTFFKKIANLLFKEILSAIKVLGSILIIIVICSIFKTISDSLENQSVSKITYYVQYILIVTLILSNFSEIINLTKETISNLVGFMNSLVPLMITLMMTTGSFVSAGIMEPIILFCITFMGNLIQTVIIPFLLISTTIGIISNISTKVQIGKLSKFFNSSIIWVLGIILTIFVGILSLEGNLGSSIDGITVKTTKAAVTSLIPVVGKILGETVDSVLGCAVILKNALGVVSVIIVISICILPILKLAAISITYHFAAAICEPLADEKIIKVIEQMGGTFKILLGIISAVAVMLIIGLTIVIKVTNSGVMYR